MRALIQQLRVHLTPNSNQTDAELLSAFLEQADGGAFETIVRRHACMVLSVCRRLAGNEADAEDAFQATFIVLAKKAHSVRPRRMLPGWLYGVAYRAALKVRSSVVRCQRNLQELATVSRPTQSERADEQLLETLDEEIARLPEELRTPLVLCELEGKTRKQAAEQLGWPEGTVASRLARARRLLATRMNARPEHLASLLPGLSSGSALTISSSLLTSTLEVVTWNAAGAASGELVRATVLAQEVIRSMLYAKIKWASIVLAVLTTTGLIGTSLSLRESTAAPTPKVAADSDVAARVLTPRLDIPYVLLENAEIAKELKLTDEQTKAVQDALSKAKTSFKEKCEQQVNAIVKGGGGQAAIAAKLAFNPEELLSEMLGKDSDLARTVEKVLKPGQILRMRQLVLQASGPAAFTNRRVVRALKLTEKQEDTVEDLLAGYRKEQTSAIKVNMGAIINVNVGGAIGLPVADNKAEIAKLAQIKVDATARCVKLLDQQQKTLWDSIIGKPASPAVLGLMSSEPAGQSFAIDAKGPAILPLPGQRIAIPLIPGGGAAPAQNNPGAPK